jgi:flagellar hook-basal body complex protein FliE
MMNTIPGLNELGQKIGVGGTTTPASAGGTAFVQTLQETMQKVEALQTEAEKQVGGMLSGQGVDVHSALIAVEKADLSFQLMMQVRNKIVDAYQQISQMPF